ARLDTLGNSGSSATCSGVRLWAKIRKLGAEPRLTRWNNRRSSGPSDFTAVFADGSCRMENAHDTLSDVPDPQSRHRRTSRRDDDPGESAGGGSEPELFDADALLPGAVFMVPNRHWGFEVVSASDHPGACTHYQPGANDATLVKGTDAENVRHRRGYF